jgi:hypothetical protein
MITKRIKTMGAGAVEMAGYDFRIGTAEFQDIFPLITSHAKGLCRLNSKMRIIYDVHVTIGELSINIHKRGAPELSLIQRYYGIGPYIFYTYTQQGYSL